MNTLEEKRQDMEREAWIKNVMRILKFDRTQAEAYYNKIKVFSDGRPKLSIEECVDKIAYTINPNK